MGPACGDDVEAPGGPADAIADAMADADARPPADGAIDGAADSATPAVCGDGVVGGDEACDDGNDVPYDGCLSDCSEWALATGDPIEPADTLTWEVIEVEGAVCRDGRPASFAINLNPDSDKVLIYLEGGGACFNESCDLTAFDIPFVPPPDGIFNRANERNPVGEWSMVYVPYCTGDVHAGDQPDAVVDGLDGVHQFVGYRNIGLFLERLVPTFRESTQVLLTGISAGGFGAALNYERVQRAFGPIEVALLDDSGPPMRSDVIPTCLQRTWREAWNLEATVLADCGADCPSPDDWAFDLGLHLVRAYPDIRGGLFSNTGDSVIRTFYGFGLNECDPLPLASVPIAAYREGLLDFRSSVMAEGEAFGTYYQTGIGHTCLRGPCFYTTEVDGVRLTEWVDDILDGGTVDHVGPGF